MLSTLHHLDRSLAAFGALDRLSRDLERAWAGGSRGGVPVNVYENDEALVFRLMLPGFTAEDVEINLEDDVLTLSGQREVSPPEGYAALHRERRPLRFSRSFRLPVEVDPEATRAQLQNGVLTLSLPKRAPSRRTIPVNAS